MIQNNSATITLKNKHKPLPQNKSANLKSLMHSFSISDGFFIRFSSKFPGEPKYTQHGQIHAPKWHWEKVKELNQLQKENNHPVVEGPVEIRMKSTARGLTSMKFKASHRAILLGNTDNRSVNKYLLNFCCDLKCPHKGAHVKSLVPSP